MNYHQHTKIRYDHIHLVLHLPIVDTTSMERAFYWYSCQYLRKNCAVVVALVVVVLEAMTLLLVLDAAAEAAAAGPSLSP